MIPNKLYHATYEPFLNSIEENGLGATENKMWEDSKPGIVYLATDPWVAESYAETSELADSELLDNIIILEVDTSKLDINKLAIDRNVLLDEDEESATLEYYGIIPWEACKIFEEDAMTEKLHNNSKGYNMIEFSEKVGWDSSARDWARALINALEDDNIRILDYYEDRNFCDFKVNQHGDIITYRVRPGGQITIRAQESYDIADEFKLYETLWEQQ